VIDPGFGFGKNLEHNLALLKHLASFRELGYPILVGTSRKGFIGTLLNLPVDQRIEGTAATVAVSIMNGANIVRVHDVKEMKRVAVVTDAIMKNA
jgi:dihydropteroate synthase